MFGTSPTKESIESWVDINVGDKGAASNNADGNMLTIVVTVLTT